MNTRKNRKIVEIGDSVKDRITSFKGVVTSISEFLGGCTRVGVKSRELIDGKPIDTQLFDLADLTIEEKEVIAPAEIKKPEFGLGDRVQCKISKAIGIVTSRTVGIDGEIGYGVTPETPTKEGKPAEAFFLNQQTIQQVQEQVHEEPRTKRAGGNQRVPGLR